MKNNLEQLNIPITEMLEILDFEIQQGYKVSWRVVENLQLRRLSKSGENPSQKTWIWLPKWLMI